jgi:MioC protein
MTKISIFVATMTGTAEMIAEEIISHFGSSRELDLHLLQEASIEMLRDVPVALFVSSTYGEGEVPEPTIPFLQQLEQRRPNLSRLTFGVIGLGDEATYPDTFAAGGRHWDRALRACGAMRHGDLLIVDASDQTDPVAKSVAWTERWLATLPAFSAV